MSRLIDFPGAPALLALLLGLGLIVQLALPSQAPVSIRPEARSAPPLASVRFAPTPDPAPFLVRPIFSPDRSTGGAGGIGGASVLVGVESAGAAGAAVLQLADGSDQVLDVGEALGDWRLVRVAPDAAVFQHGGASVTLRVGAPLALRPAAGLGEGRP